MDEDRVKLLEDALRRILIAHNTGWELSAPNLEDNEENRKKVTDAGIAMGKAASMGWAALGGYPDSEIERLERVTGTTMPPEVRARFQSSGCFVPEQWEKLEN